MRKDIRGAAGSAKKPVCTFAKYCMGHFSGALVAAGTDVSDTGVAVGVIIACMAPQWCLPFARQQAGVWVREPAAIGAITDKAITTNIVMEKKRRILSSE